MARLSACLQFFACENRVKFCVFNRCTTICLEQRLIVFFSIEICAQSSHSIQSSVCLAKCAEFLLRCCNVCGSSQNQQTVSMFFYRVRLAQTKMKKMLTEFLCQKIFRYSQNQIKSNFKFSSTKNYG